MFCMTHWRVAVTSSSSSSLSSSSSASGSSYFVTHCVRKASFSMGLRASLLRRAQSCAKVGEPVAEASRVGRVITLELRKICKSMTEELLLHPTQLPSQDKLPPASLDRSRTRTTTTTPTRHDDLEPPASRGSAPRRSSCSSSSSSSSSSTTQYIICHTQQ